MPPKKRIILLTATVLIVISILLAVFLISRPAPSPQPDPFILIIDFDNTGYGDELLDAIQDNTAEYGYLSMYSAIVEEGRVEAEVYIVMTSREKQDAIDALWELLKSFGQYDNDHAGKLNAIVYWNPNRRNSDERLCHIMGWIEYKAARQIDWNQGSEGLYDAYSFNRYADKDEFGEGEAWQVIIDFPSYKNVPEECE